jgi:hypothetical protein
MREIKFRGQLFSDKWVYGYYAELPLDGHPTSFIYDGEWHEVKTGTVGQYTGIKDSTGKEIFEGDVVVAHDDGRDKPERWQIVFKDARFSAENGRDLIGLHYWSETQVTRIGNIFEHPGLLEGK